MISVNTYHPFTSTAERTLLHKLTPARLTFLEKTPIFSPGEKVRLLGIFTHHRWITEIDIHLKNKDTHIAALKKLGLPWRINGYEHRNVKWIQVGANQAVLDYIEHYKNEISSLEAGILYGYPLTAVLGFVDVLRGEGDKKKGSGHHKNVAEFYLSGVFSEDFTKQETDYFNEVWSSLKKVSPKIISEAESYFRFWQKERDSRDKNKPFSYEECREKWLFLRGNM